MKENKNIKTYHQKNPSLLCYEK